MSEAEANVEVTEQTAEEVTEDQHQHQHETCSESHKCESCPTAESPSDGTEESEESPTGD